MVKRRRQINSISERVQTLSLGQREGLLTSLKSTSASFRWQHPGQCYADVSEIMRCPAFRIGSDGTNWWWHYESTKGKQISVCPIEEIGRADILFCDPFSLMRKTPVQTGTDLGLS